MSGVNVNISVSNLVQVDRHHDSTYRTPVINQTQNTEIVKHEAVMRTMMPVEPDAIEKKKIDKDSKKLQKQTFVKKKNAKKDQGLIQKRNRSDNGYLIDFEA